MICVPRHVLFALLLAVVGARAAAAADGTPPDAARGRVLYEQRCGACHTPGIHARSEKLPMTRDELRMLVDTFRRQGGIAWTRDEIEDVVEYLNRTRYRFPPDERR